MVVYRLNSPKECRELLSYLEGKGYQVKAKGMERFDVDLPFDVELGAVSFYLVNEKGEEIIVSGGGAVREIEETFGELPEVRIRAV